MINQPSEIETNIEPEWRLSTTLVAYPEAVAFMEQRAAEIRDGLAPETIWLLQHPPLYTAGTSARPEDLLAPRQLPVFASGRGGQYTYHGPGQRIAYVLHDLKQRNGDVRAHVWRLEQWVIDTLAHLGVVGERRPGRVGIWVVDKDGHEDKIAAIGVRVRRWVSYHGLALNVAPELAHYAGIVPCGIREHGVTSLAALGIETSLEHIDAVLRQTYPAIFGK